MESTIYGLQVSCHGSTTRHGTATRLTLELQLGLEISGLRLGFRAWGLGFSYLVLEVLQVLGCRLSAVQGLWKTPNQGYGGWLKDF